MRKGGGGGDGDLLRLAGVIPASWIPPQAVLGHKFEYNSFYGNYGGLCIDRLFFLDSAKQIKVIAIFLDAFVVIRICECSLAYFLMVP